MAKWDLVPQAVQGTSSVVYSREFVLQEIDIGSMIN